MVSEILDSQANKVTYSAKNRTLRSSLRAVTNDGTAIDDSVASLANLLKMYKKLRCCEEKARHSASRENET